MPLTPLKKRNDLNEDPKALKKFSSLENLIAELNKKDIPAALEQSFNDQIEQVNRFSGPVNDLKKLLKKTQADIIKAVQKELKLTPKHFYRNMWLALGMTVFGMPMGMTLGFALDNMAFLAIGLPVGMSVGIAVGTAMDNKAQTEGKQLEADLVY